LVGDIVRGVNVSESPSSKGVYNNLRSELWFKAKAWFESRTCKVPKNDELLADLTAITYTFSASGKMQAETKDSMRKRGLRSPDLADALCLSFASDEITMLRGPMRGWDGPLRRNLAGIV
jgi:phage terminase large subunit